MYYIVYVSMEERACVTDRKPSFSLKNGRSSVVWWYYFTAEDGRRLRFNLAAGSKTRARYLLDQKIRSGELVPDRQAVLRLEDFTRDFWVWDRCHYVKGRLLRGERISRRWARQ